MQVYSGIILWLHIPIQHRICLGEVGTFWVLKVHFQLFCTTRWVLFNFSEVCIALVISSWLHDWSIFVRNLQYFSCLPAFVLPFHSLGESSLYSVGRFCNKKQSCTKRCCLKKITNQSEMSETQVPLHWSKPMLEIIDPTDTQIQTVDLFSTHSPVCNGKGVNTIKMIKTRNVSCRPNLNTAASLCHD